MTDLLVSDPVIRLAILVGAITSVVLLRAAFRDLPRPHRHHDPDYQLRGIHRYDACPCGARRVRRVVPNLIGPSDPAWPPLRDRHGRMLDDTGWVSPPTDTTDVLGAPRVLYGKRPARGDQ